MKTDAYGDVVNDVMTYLTIAKTLQDHGVCVIGWSDEKGTHYDILFAVRVPQFGDIQGGQRGGSSLFVTILRRSGGFGFSTSRRELNDLFPSYVAEKLGLPEKGYTTERVTELVNGVMAAYLGLSIGANDR